MQQSDDPLPSLPVAAPAVGLLVDLGRQRRKQIKRLKRGEGRLSRHVQAAVDQSREELGIDPALEIVPVVLLYRRSEPGYVVLTPQP
jgi:hypothetical protein